MNSKSLREMGIPPGEAARAAQAALRRLAEDGVRKRAMGEQLQQVVANPSAYLEDAVFAALAAALCDPPPEQERAEPAPWRQWGQDLDAGAVDQMANACRLPVAVAGALMPDAHLGYGLPIGGVLATENAVVPYAVGVDIACRMKLSVLDVPTDWLVNHADRLARALQEETRFGVGAKFAERQQHAVLDRDWSVSPITKRVRDKAWSQLGTSGSGNHFVEFGLLRLERSELGLDPGSYLAVMSHSGSRGTGAMVASHYSRLAREVHRGLSQALQHLAWLSLDSQEGQEYWAAMELMGHYASANHAIIHANLARALGAEVLAGVENHHNFAWKEVHAGRQVVVHRKGATPAGRGVLGVIPGSMASPAYVVRGRGSPESMDSASHGAGRVMSRTAARKRFRWKDVREHLRKKGVTLLSAGLDEVPMVYKDINAVMADQQDLVDILARFDPRIVKMAPEGERPED